MAEFARDIEEARAEAEPEPIDAAAVELALSGGTEYFITTRLFWDCECQEDRIRPGRGRGLRRLRSTPEGTAGLTPSTKSRS